MENLLLKEKKILIIEDDPDHADLILDILEIENAEVKVILMRDGQEVIDYFMETYSSASPTTSSGQEQAVKAGIKRGIGRHPQIDLIILDLNLPKINGMDVLKFLKKNSRYCSIPIVILSTSSDQDTIDKAYKAGANAFITKPTSYDEFVEKKKLLKIC
ncbi:MAG: two-component response regulator [Candidatus Scalindua rubra]|uniref:Two-component response regulator n=1 Tax=Candidatus Scalindua rubra TaxID=1872076 RepID=A0A1E3X9N0_9BACT|nr:MAG: two-component response regulator [Candidatus Scalindua rubra]